MLGIRSVPIVRRGKDWANGQVLREVARVAGIARGGAQVLPAPELVARLTEIQTAAQRLFAQTVSSRKFSISVLRRQRLFPVRPSYVIVKCCKSSAARRLIGQGPK
jgi:hypothetical protein